MELDKLDNRNLKKALIGITALLIGIAAGYALSTTMQPEEEEPYCKGLEDDLKEENKTNLNCHEPGWVALSSADENIENRTDLQCTCTRVEDGELTIFPIRRA